MEMRKVPGASLVKRRKSEPREQHVQQPGGSAQIQAGPGERGVSAERRG